jgi:hypothetical protein
MFVYRDVKWSEVPKLIARVVRTVGMVMIMIGFSIAFGYMMAILQVPAMATEFFVAISSDKYTFLLYVNVLLLLLGTFMDLAPMLLICTPIFLPVIKTFGIDPVHFGIIMILNLGIGLLTPPVGPTMVVGCAIGRVSMEAVSRSILIFYVPMLIVLALASLAVGNVTAIAQANFKRMLAYSTIGQVGFMLLALASGVQGMPGNMAAAANAYGAAMFYVVSYALTAAGAFGVILLLARDGFEAEDIADLKGLNRRSPWFAFVLLLFMFSLAGIPPTMGFWAKYFVLTAWLADGLNGYNVIVAVVALVFSLIAAFYYLRIVKVMYFDEPVNPLASMPPIAAAPDMRLALTLNGLLVIAVGLLPGRWLALFNAALAATLGG